MNGSSARASLPYPGLRPFEAEDYALFFGREVQIGALLRRMEDDRFLAVVGSSGCGKSSLVRAGLLPALQEGFLHGLTGWRMLVIKPGHQPYHHLAEKLINLSDASHKPINSTATLDKDVSGTEIFETLTLTDHGLLDVLADLGMDQPTLLLVDQFEELFGYRRENARKDATASRDEAAAFVNMLLRTGTEAELKIWVLITMRSDFIGDCEAFLGLPETVSRSQFLVPRLDRSQMEDVIRRPGEITGAGYRPFSFQEGLVNRIINEAGDRPDQLPLLQHALMRTWKFAVKRADAAGVAVQLTIEDYKKAGRIAQAIAKDADAAWGKFKDDPRQAKITRALFLLLCDVSTEGQITRRRPQVREIEAVTGASVAEIDEIIKEFQTDDRNFLVVNRPLNSGSYLDICHESLIRQWDTYRQWVCEETQSVEEYRALCREARNWENDPANLMGGKKLTNLLMWWARECPTPAWARRFGGEDQFRLAQDFLKASEEEEDKKILAEEHKRRLKLRRAVISALASGVFALFLVVGIIAYIVAYIDEYDEYFNAYVKIRGVPKGIGLLTQDQVDHRSLSYKITRRGRLESGPVISMAAVDAGGQAKVIVDDLSAFDKSSEDNRSENLQISRQEFYYDAQGHIAHEVSLDKSGKRVGSITYSPYVENESDDKRIAYQVGSQGSLASKLNSCQAYVKYIYDSQGREIETHYLDQMGNPTPGRDRAYIMKKSYDPSGNITEVQSLYKDRTLMNDEAGNAIFRMEYDPMGNMLSSFNLDAGKAPITYIKEGFSTTRSRYDDPYGRLRSQAFFDEFNHPVNHLEDNYHRYQVDAYDDSGNVMEESFWLADGKPAQDAKGCFIYRYKYDDRGNLLQQTCLDTHGKPMLNYEGIAVETYRYDEHNRLTESAYLDEKYKPADWLKVRYSYDPEGNLSETAYFSRDEKPVVAESTGAHKSKSRFFAGHETQAEYFDENGHLIISKEGYAKIEKTYDNQGNLIKEAYFGADNRPISPAMKGYAVKLSRFDSCGREIEHRFLDGSQKLVENKLLNKKYALVRKTYDADNYLKEETYFDVHERPIRLRRDGFARKTEARNKHGQLIDLRYFDENLEPVRIGNDFAVYKSEYDDHNGLLKQEYFDEKEMPVLYRGDARIE